MSTPSRRSTSPVMSPATVISALPYSGGCAAGSSSAFASYSSSLSSRSSAFFVLPTSPTRVNLVGSGSPSPSVRFTIDRPTSPGRQFLVGKKTVPAPAVAAHRRMCMCSPTTHPGSFRCSLHKGVKACNAFSSPSHRLNARRSAMTNSLVRIGTVEGEWVKRALTALIRPSSHQQRRRAAFQPRPSRLSVMSMAEDI